MRLPLAALAGLLLVLLWKHELVAAQTNCTVDLLHLQPEPSECRGNYVLRIRPWYGRTGNNLISLANAIHLGQRTNSEVIASSHPLLRQTEWDFRKTSEKEREWDIAIHGGGSIGRQQIFTDDFYHEDEMPIRIPDWSFGSTMQREVLISHVLPALRIVPNHERNAVVVHIRSGDVFSSPVIHPCYGTYILLCSCKPVFLRMPCNILRLCLQGNHHLPFTSQYCSCQKCQEGRSCCV